MKQEESVTGATSTSQTVGRAIQLIRLVASSKSHNLRLIDIAEMASLDKSTAHRLLQRLVQERMLARDPGRRGYRLGPLLHELGLGALPETNVEEAAEPALRQLARITGDMAFLSGRSGLEIVCLRRIAGNFEIQTLARNVGDRHPLGIGAAGLAILAAMNNNDADVAIEAIAPQLGRYNLTEEVLRERIIQTRRRGYALDEGSAALDIVALGRVVRNRGGVPSAVVFVASISSRMTEMRQRMIDKHVLECVASIEAALVR
ncbi:IclR family transcriptional regulator C-terminal domain-containing protein [Bordetella sputigena]|uniref:IclR family transcriptional regulator n=1 Tax=Bordetella sputigena TaxID=1416810 RepID=UPI0039F0EF5A